MSHSNCSIASGAALCRCKPRSPSFISSGSPDAILDAHLFSFLSLMFASLRDFRSATTSAFCGPSEDTFFYFCLRALIRSFINRPSRRDFTPLRPPPGPWLIAFRFFRLFFCASRSLFFLFFTLFVPLKPSSSARSTNPTGDPRFSQL